MTHVEWIAAGHCDAVHPKYGWCVGPAKVQHDHHAPDVVSDPGHLRVHYWVDEETDLMPDETLVPDNLNPDEPSLGGFGHATSVEPGVEDENRESAYSEMGDKVRQAEAS